MNRANMLSTELRGFLERLRREGFNIGAAQHIAAQDLMLSLQAQGRMPKRFSGLRSLLGPIICSSPKEQEDFKNRFNHWAARFEKLEAELSQPSAQTQLAGKLEQAEKKRHGWTVVLVSVAAVLLAGFFAYLISHQFDFASLSTPDPDDPTHLPPALLEAILSYTAYIFGSIVCVFLLFLAVTALRNMRRKRQQQQSFLSRRTAVEPPEIRELFVETARHGLFKSVLLNRVAQQLRKHVQLESEQLNVDASVRETTRTGGWFVPINATINVLPEYLVLIDKTAFEDHQATWADTLMKQLSDQGLIVECYYFNGDPRRCFPARKDSSPESLADLAGRYAHYRLMIFSDGEAFVDPVGGLPEPWLEQFSHWPQRAFFTLEDPMHWGRREWALSNEDFLVMPASEAGFHALAQSLNAEQFSGQSPPESSVYPPLFPEIIQEFPHEWLGRHAPAKEMQAELLEQLRAYLDADSLDWLCACAVYPKLQWELTLFLGYQIPGRESKCCLSEKGLTRLVRLPWFRHGYMPDWLRETLLDELPDEREQAVRTALYQLFLEASPDKPLQDFRLEIAKQASGKHLGQQLLKRWKQQAPADSPLRDYVFENVTDGRLKVKIRRLWRKAFKDPLRAQTQAETEPAGKLHQTRLPRILGLLWMIFMQPITLHMLLRNFGLRSLRFSLLDVWKNRDKQQAFLQRHLLWKLFLAGCLIYVLDIALIHAAIALIDATNISSYSYSISNRIIYYTDLMLLALISILSVAALGRKTLSAFFAPLLTVAIPAGIIGVCVKGLGMDIDNESLEFFIIFSILSSPMLLVWNSFAGLIGAVIAIVFIIAVEGIRFLHYDINLFDSRLSGIASVSAIGITVGTLSLFAGTIKYFVIYGLVSCIGGAGVFLIVSGTSGNLETTTLLIALLPFLMYFRIPFYIFECLWQICCCFLQKWTGRFTLQHSPVLYHDFSFLPYPFLEKHLLLSAEQNPAQVRRVLDACAAAPGQRRIGQRVLQQLQAKEAGLPSYKQNFQNYRWPDMTPVSEPERLLAVAKPSSQTENPATQKPERPNVISPHETDSADSAVKSQYKSAVFVLSLPSSKQAGFPDNKTIQGLVRKFGWDPIEAYEMEETAELEKIYREKALALFSGMPAITQTEQNGIIGYGILAEDQTEFVMTRIVTGQVIFRVFQKNPERLNLSTDKLIRKLVSTKIFKQKLKVSEKKVTISEVSSGEICYSGRVIQSVFGEVLATDVIDVVFSIAPLALMFLIWIVASLKVSGNVFFNSFIGALFMELDKAMLAVLAVSLIELVNSFWKISKQDEKSNAPADPKNVRRNKLMRKILNANVLELVFIVTASLFLPFAWIISADLSSLAPDYSVPKLQAAFVVMFVMSGMGILGLTINYVRTSIRIGGRVIVWK